MPSHKLRQKCLMLVLTLVSAMQCLQGSPVVCASVISPSLLMRCDCGCELTRSSKRAESSNTSFCECRVTENQRVPEMDASPKLPVECPANCWCRRPPQPQPEPVQTRQLERSTNVLLIPVGQVAAANVFATGNHTNSQSFTSPESARAICAVLCRFLT